MNRAADQVAPFYAVEINRLANARERAGLPVIHMEVGQPSAGAPAAAIAAARTVDSDPSQGGITGFQASMIMWCFVQNWMGWENQPLQLQRFENMLYPQYEQKFRSITKDTHDWLIEQAKKKLAETEHPVAQAVVEHWKKIDEGWVPFGFAVND